MDPSYKVELMAAASLGCIKCTAELESGIKTHRAHCANCPRSRSYKSRKDYGTNNTAILDNYGHTNNTHTHTHHNSSCSADSIAIAATAALNKRKRDNGGTTEQQCDDYQKATGESVPKRMGNSVDFPLSNLRPHLICSLCRGYFRDPYTVADCLHTFCRSCLILFFRQGMRCCPTCNTRLGPDPFHTSISIQSREVMPDRTLQEVVNKIFPWMKSKEDEEERNFYLQRGIEWKPEYKQEESKATHSSSSSSSSVGSVGSVSGANRQGESGGGKMNVPRATNDMLELHFEPDGHPPHAHQRLPPLRNSLLCMSGRTKIISLKKYLSQKLGMKDSKNLIEVLCNGDPMGDELSLTFIFRTRWFRTNKVLTLKYRLEEENTK